MNAIKLFYKMSVKAQKLRVQCYQDVPLPLLIMLLSQKKKNVSFWMRSWPWPWPMTVIRRGQEGNGKARRPYKQNRENEEEV